MPTTACTGEKELRIFSAVPPAVCPKPILREVYNLIDLASSVLLTCSDNLWRCSVALLLFQEGCSCPQANFHSSLTISGNIMSKWWSPRSGRSTYRTFPPVLRAWNPSRVKEKHLQLNKLWCLTKQKQSVWEPERLMWVNSTCRAGRGEGQAGCDWQSDKLLDVGLHLSPFISHISNSFSTGLIFYFT